MRRIGTLAGVIIGLFILSIIFVVWYKATYSMGISPTYSVNTPEASGELIIITQASDFKDAIVEEVVDHFKVQDVFIRVADVTQLPDIKISEWNTIFIFHTWEIGKPPKEIRSFLKKNIDLSNILFFTTSGSGEEYNKGVDGLTGASKLNTVPAKAQEVIQRISDIMDTQQIAY